MRTVSAPHNTLTVATGLDWRLQARDLSNSSLVSVWRAAYLTNSFAIAVAHTCETGPDR